MMKMNKFYSFPYLDCYNIDQIYSQLFENIIEQSIINSNEGKFDSTVNANLLGILGSNLKGQASNLTSVNTTYNLTSSQKAALLVERFRNEKISIQEIISENQAKEESIFFVGSATFFLRDIQDVETGKSQLGDRREISPLTDNSLFIFESGNTPFIKQYFSENAESHDKHVEYVISISKQAKYDIVMKLSNSKFQKSIRHLNKCVCRGMYNHFYVFGQLIELSTNFYSVNPFAIWL